MTIMAGERPRHRRDRQVEARRKLFQRGDTDCQLLLPNELFETFVIAFCKIANVLNLIRGDDLLAMSPPPGHTTLRRTSRAVGIVRAFAKGATATTSWPISARG